MPQIQLAQKPKDINGNEIPVDETSKETASLGRFCVMALDMALQTDQSEPASKTFDRGKLAHDIMHAEHDLKPLDLKAEQIAMLKERVAKLRPASLAYTLVQMLDPTAGTHE